MRNYQYINSSYLKQIEQSKMRAFLMGKSGKEQLWVTTFSHIKEEQFCICFLFFSTKNLESSMNGQTPGETRFAYGFLLKRNSSQTQQQLLLLLFCSFLRSLESYYYLILSSFFCPKNLIAMLTNKYADVRSMFFLKNVVKKLIIFHVSESRQSEFILNSKNLLHYLNVFVKYENTTYLFSFFI